MRVAIERQELLRSLTHVQSVVAPAWLTSAGEVSTTSISRSVADSCMPELSAFTRRFERIGIVFRRSTTL